MSRICFIRAWPRNPATGAAALVAMAGGGGATPYFLGGQHYRAGVVKEPRFSSALGFDKGGWTGGALPTSSVISFAPADPALLIDLGSRYWRGAAIEIDAGEEGGSLARQLTGTVSDVTIKSGQLVLTVADFGAQLTAPAINRFFAGTGGTEGEAVVKGRVRRRSYGRVFNVEGRIFDPVNNVYEFGDLERRLQSFVVLRDMGRAGNMAILPWQGSAAATLVALKASAPPPGGGVVAPSIACAKWWTQPAGPLTADLLGEIGDGYSETAAGVAVKLLTAASGPRLIDYAAVVALRPAAVGIHIGDERETTAAILDRLFLPISLVWRLSPIGEIDVMPFTWADDADVVQGSFISREQTLAPHWSRRLSYRRNNRSHGDGEIAAPITAGDVTFSNGETLEFLKPAEGGADKTGNHTSKDTAAVGGRPVAEVISDLDLNGQNWFDMAALEATRDALMLARTTLEGAPIGTVVANFKTEFSDEKSATAETFALIGAKAGDGLSILLDQSTVRVGPADGGAGPIQSLGQRFQSINVSLGSHSGSINDLKTVLIDPQGGVTAKAVLALNVDGRMSGIVATATGVKSTLEMLFDSYSLLAPDGTSLFFAEAGVVKMPAVEVDTLKIGTAVTPVRIAATAPIGGTISYTSGIPPRIMRHALTIHMPVEGWIEVDATIKQNFPSGVDDRPWACSLWVDGNEMLESLQFGSQAQDSVTMKGSFYASRGDRLLELGWDAHYTVSLLGRTVFAKGYPFT
ncbi:MAG TPA: hypothetical protein VF463_08425 [Sphingobium sp.]